MDERDELAKAAMQGLLAGWPESSHFWSDVELLTKKVAETAYAMADAMREARGPKKPIATPKPSHGTPSL